MLTMELTGPKVRAEKLGTSDRGGGLLVAHAGQLQIRGKLHSRTLGELNALQSLRFEDPDGRRAEAVFQDLSRWAIEAEEAGLVEFAHGLEAGLGRAGLVTDPPKLSQRVREAMGSQAKRRIVEAVLAIALGVGTELAIRQVAPLGWVIVVGAVLWIALVGLALFQDDPEGPLERVRALFERHGWAVTLLLPMCLAFGAGLGMQAGAQQKLLEAQLQQLRADAAQAVENKTRAHAERFDEQQSAMAAQARTLEAALEAQRWVEAKAAHEALAALDPKHPALPAAWATIGPQLEAQAERERTQAVEAALRDARRMQSDPIVCDDPRAVAAAWKAIRELAADDPRRAAATKLVPGIERCRKVVARSLANNAAELQRQERIRLAPRLQDELRRAGHLVDLTLAGKAEDLVRISGDSLTAKTVPEVTQQGSKAPDSLLGRMQAQGVRRVEIVAGKRSLATFKLDPRDTATLAAELLDGMGLREPLVLAD